MSVSSEEKRKEGGIVETVRVIFHALIIALVIRTFLFQPFNIPSGSMKDTLLIGDYLFVSKYSYGYSHYSLPLSPPLFSGRVFGSAPERGDVASSAVSMVVIVPLGASGQLMDATALCTFCARADGSGAKPKAGPSACPAELTA